MINYKEYVAFNRAGQQSYLLRRNELRVDEGKKFLERLKMRLVLILINSTILILTSLINQLY